MRCRQRRVPPCERLANPVNDAKGVRDALQKLNFDVVYGEDLDLKALSRAIGQFADKVADADVALVFFAGHGATFGETPYVVLDLISQSFDEAHSPSHRATANTFPANSLPPHERVKGSLRGFENSLWRAKKFPAGTR